MGKFIDINQQQFEELLKIMCTQEEILRVLNVSKNALKGWVRRTYNDTYEEVAARFYAVGRMSIRRAGFSMSQRNPAVHIFYAKNYLNMTDEPREMETGDQTAAFDNAINTATKALGKCNLDELAKNPLTATPEDPDHSEEEEGGDR